MNRNLFYQDLKHNLKSILGATFAVIAFIAITIGVYSAMRENMAMITDLYATMPEAIMEALNFHEEQWNTMLGFYVTYFVYYIPIMGGIYAYYLASRLLSTEEQNKTAEFLLSRPLSRGSILLTKLFVFLFSICSFNLAVFLVGMISCGLASDWDFSIRSFSVLHLYGLVFCCFIGLIGFFISVSMKKGKSSLMTGIGIVMGSYMFDMIIRITDKAQVLAYLTPFKYMDINATSPDYALEAWRILALLGASGLLIFFSILWYKRKDILI